jgi:hypothetical protein
VDHLKEYNLASFGTTAVFRDTGRVIQTLFCPPTNTTFYSPNVLSSSAQIHSTSTNLL